MKERGEKLSEQKEGSASKRGRLKFGNNGNSTRAAENRKRVKFSQRPSVMFGVGGEGTYTVGQSIH